MLGKRIETCETLFIFQKFRQRLLALPYRLWITHGGRIFGRLFYGDWFYKICEKDNAKSHPVIARALVAALAPDHVVDFGCGDGSLLSEFAKAGVGGIGYEFSKAGLRRCQKRGVSAVELDFRKHILPTPLPKGAVVVCLEVAEHLPREDADFLIVLLSCCEGSKWLVFAAATPGQGGEGHLNEQPHDYWRAKLEAQDWRFSSSFTEHQRAIWRKGGVAFYYWQNLQIFERWGVIP